MTRKLLFVIPALAALAAGCGDGPKPADPKPAADAKVDPRIERAGSPAKSEAGHKRGLPKER